MKPVFIHDCDHCEFLGVYTHRGYTYDLYHHDGEIEHTVIARFGSRPDQYESGLSIAKWLSEKDAKHPLAVALHRVEKNAKC